MQPGRNLEPDAAEYRLYAGGRARPSASSAHKARSAARAHDAFRFERRPARASSQLTLQARALNARRFPLFAASIEAAVLAGATFLAVALYHYVQFRTLPSPLFYAAANIALAGLFVTQCALARDHSIKRLLDAREQLRSVFVRWNTSYSLFVFALFMVQATEFYSRGSVLAQYVAGLVTAILVRMLMARFVARGLDNGTIRGRKVVVIGEQDSNATVMRWLAWDGRGADVIKTITLAPAEAARSVDGWQQAIAQTRAALRETEDTARRAELDDIVIALPWTQNDRIEALVEGLAAVPATIHLAPDYALNRRHPVLARVGNMHTLRLSRAPLTLKDHVIKRIFDITVATSLLVIAAPALLLIALAIKLDSCGPVLFRQRRNGFNQHEFRVFKFRTMTTLDDGNHVPQATRNDTRVTRVGRLLRRTNLDEVPQLFNVIAGDMSLVGPRPHAVAHNNAYEERIRLYARRHNVKPGITGWAQVNGYRGETDTVDKMARRVEHDLYYIDHWSVLLDIRVLLMTLFSLRSYRNAY